MTRLANPEPFQWDEDGQPIGWVEARDDDGRPCGWSYRETEAAAARRRDEALRQRITLTPGQVATLRRARR